MSTNFAVHGFGFGGRLQVSPVWFLEAHCFCDLLPRQRALRLDSRKSSNSTRYTPIQHDSFPVRVALQSDFVFQSQERENVVAGKRRWN
eukprot:3689746-Amphidinium_carterae.1